LIPLVASRILDVGRGADGSFDCIITLDALKHLGSWAYARRAEGEVGGSEGNIVASIRNIRNWDVLGS
jgi:hypothetical protein